MDDMKVLEKDGVIDHDAIETIVRVQVLEAIVSLQSNALVAALSLFEDAERTRQLKGMEDRLKEIEADYKTIYMTSLSPMDSDYSAELIQEVLSGYFAQMRRSLGIHS